MGLWDKLVVLWLLRQGRKQEARVRVVANSGRCGLRWFQSVCPA